MVLVLASLGGAPPCGFSQNAPEVLGISLWNLPYLSGQQFHTSYKKIRSQVIIGQPWVTSEWRHVPLILTNNKGWQETPPRSQFLSYDQFSFMIWRGISRATKLLSRIFKILKISANLIKISNLFSKKNSHKIKIFKKPYNILKGNVWWIRTSYNYLSDFPNRSEWWWISLRMTSLVQFCIRS